MFVRVIKYRVKQDALSKTEEMGRIGREALARADGMQRCVTAWNDDGEAVVVGIWDSEEAARKAQPVIQKAWESLADYHEGQLQPVEYRNGMMLRG